MRRMVCSDCQELVKLATVDPCDTVDVALLRALAEDPRAATVALADRIGVSRNTVHAHLRKWDDKAVLSGFDRRINPASLGYPLRAFVLTRVEQRLLDHVAAELRSLIEVIAVDGLSGADDLLVQVVARDTDDLYRIAGRILAIDGVERTSTSLVMRELVQYRTVQLLSSPSTP